MAPERTKLSRWPVATVLALAFAMVAAIAYMSYASGRSRDVAAAQATIFRQVQGQSNELLSLMKDAETGQRGFLIWGRESYLEPYNQAISAVPGIFPQFEEASKGRPDQAERARALRRIIDAKLQELAETIALRRTQGLVAAQKVVETDRGKNLMDDIGSRSAAMSTAAEQSLAERTMQAEASNNRLRLVSTFGSMILLGSSRSWRCRSTAAWRIVKRFTVKLQ